MANLKLTAKSIKELAGPADGRAGVIHYDADVPGFGLRITRAGARSFVLNYRASGVERRMTIGSLPPNAGAEETRTLIDAARKQATKLRNAAKYEGRDPMGERHEDRAAKTVADLAERYLSDHAPKKRPASQREDQSMIDKIILPAIRNKRVADVRYADVDAIHRKLKETPIRANRVVALLSKMFSLAIRWQWRADNPAKGIERNPENRRQRYLSNDELKRLSAVLKTAPSRPSANAVRLLLLTGARRGEVLGATWGQFDLTTGIWIKPSAHTKQKKEHRVPLSAPARQLLSEMHEKAKAAARKEKREMSPHVFPSGAQGGGPQTDLKHFWETVRDKAGMPDVRVHDLRHTYASVLASAGLSLPIIGQLLGHTNPLTTSRYAHLFDDPLRAATERAGAVISRASGGRGAKVISLAEAKSRG
ncbi:MAG TPA: tyrosine-type recombinase/integrase [Xanthobacteraceae bacterium]|jgi:integrase